MEKWLETYSVMIRIPLDISLATAPILSKYIVVVFILIALMKRGNVVLDCGF